MAVIEIAGIVEYTSTGGNSDTIPVSTLAGEFLYLYAVSSVTASMSSVTDSASQSWLSDAINTASGSTVTMWAGWINNSAALTSITTLWTVTGNHIYTLVRLKLTDASIPRANFTAGQTPSVTVAPATSINVAGGAQLYGMSYDSALQSATPATGWDLVSNHSHGTSAMSVAVAFQNNTASGSSAGTITITTNANLVYIATSIRPPTVALSAGNTGNTIFNRNNKTAGTTIAGTGNGSTLTIGSKLFAAIAFPATTTVSSITDGSNTYHFVAGINNGTTSRSEVWYADNTVASNSSSMTFTITLAASVTPKAGLITEFTGAASGAPAGSATATGTGSANPTYTGATVTTTGQMLGGYSGAFADPGTDSFTNAQSVQTNIATSGTTGAGATSNMTEHATYQVVATNGTAYGASNTTHTSSVAAGVLAWWSVLVYADPPLPPPTDALQAITRGSVW